MIRQTSYLLTYYNLCSCLEPIAVVGTNLQSGFSGLLSSQCLVSWTVFLHQIPLKPILTESLFTFLFNMLVSSFGAAIQVLHFPTRLSWAFSFRFRSKGLPVHFPEWLQLEVWWTLAGSSVRSKHEPAPSFSPPPVAPNSPTCPCREAKQLVCS